MSWGTAEGDKSFRAAIADIEGTSSVEVVVAVRAHARLFLAQHVVVGLVATYALLVYGVLAKWDAVEGALTPEEFVHARFAGLHDMWKGTLANFRLFGVSSVGAVRQATGPSGEEILVPAPERGDDREGGPVFRYRPKNVSRPLVWLLSELGAPKGGAP